MIAKSPVPQKQKPKKYSKDSSEEATEVTDLLPAKKVAMDVLKEKAKK